MQTKTWIELSCTVPAQEADLLADAMTRLTGAGVCTANLAVDTFSIETIREPETVVLLGYLPGGSDPAPALGAIGELLEEIRRRTGGAIPPPASRTICEEDWANNWKAYFKPTRIGSRLLVTPTWESGAPGEGDLVIQLDPGMAFGTGTHPTTRLCLEAIERLMGCGGDRTLLDVGTGSGILAIGGALLGGAAVSGIDIDPVAVEVARQNAAQNRVGDRIHFSTIPLGEVTGLFHVVVANILAEDLVAMRHQLAARLAPGGTLVLSGILHEKEGLVLSGFADTGLNPVATTRCDDWSCLEFAREGGDA